jgi:hypothetical protein
LLLEQSGRGEGDQQKSLGGGGCDEGFQCVGREGRGS